MGDDIHEYLARHADDLVRQPADRVGIPSVAGPPEREPDLLRSANWLAAALRATGFPSVEVWAAPGASDAKGQVLSHVRGIRAHLAATGREAPAVDLLDEHRDRLGADLVVFSDTMTWHTDHPAVCTSLRGMVSAQLADAGRG
ncbi:acetylornithine deacetylase/succinyl-diaminopimelate desuccinylase-like protein [Actinoplanes octamycinicus]|uniref:Acetylornithine deacetylase/succinyl-diaminopimelate desuccinylase-like protein n=1 Tax=Actinoplanes octamycinicus TaxID=135948 RepID=A0A7W7H0L9_9ACTN|nr:hypothetical protein [Actinoplanes octamycinicus]MBB4741718.1 acetylornithine deacetylase/succinyl-diaminopimelate desuccinylase-like protein [Actinoplanes octamycinicus]GIE57271.1 hypothetical protein Aoc01nite_26730 [Actinoplanes octamycinicus]